ncbi:MAG: hypothetical protein ACYDIE_05865 [Candidatus Krumholzibacteriia bacterium]
MESLLSGALQGRSGPLFWASAIAVAAGITALTVALLLAVARLARARRRRAAAPSPSPLVAAGRAEAAPAPPPTAAVLRAYQAQAGEETAPRDPEAPAPAPGGVEPGQGGNAVRLVPLLTRLRAAANRLEEVALALEPPALAGTGNSGLKTAPEDVEYLFRTGV